MQSVYDAAGGDQGLLRLAHAWHERVLADEVVAHAFSHGFHPDHSARLAALNGKTRETTFQNPAARAASSRSSSSTRPTPRPRAVASM